MIALIESSRARCLDDLDALLAKDGETVLAQMVGELVDVSTLSWASEVADVLVPQIVQFQRLLESTGLDTIEDPSVPCNVLLEIASSGERSNEESSRF